MCVLLNGQSKTSRTFTLILLEGDFIRSSHNSPVNYLKVFFFISSDLFGWGGSVQLQVERLLDLALRRHGQIEAYVLERAQLVKAAVPRVKDFVEFDQLLGQLVDFVAAGGREVAI